MPSLLDRYDRSGLRDGPRAIHVFAVLTLLLGYSYSTRGDDSLPPPFITSLGSHRLFDGKLTLHVLEKGEFVTYKLAEAERKVKDDAFDGNIKITYLRESQIKKGAKWFVFPVSADEVWIYEGGDEITLYTVADPEHRESLNNGIFLIADKDHNILKKAPKEVLDRVPTSMKKRYNIDYSDDKPISVLTSTGSYRFFKEQMIIDFLQKDDKVHCHIKLKIPGEASNSVEVGPVRPILEKEAKRFVYPRSDDEVWYFDGRDHLILDDVRSRPSRKRLF